jgi:hypothetical protein
LRVLDRKEKGGINAGGGEALGVNDDAVTVRLAVAGWN